jgi:hypothetical protein
MPRTPILLLFLAATMTASLRSAEILVDPKAPPVELARIRTAVVGAGAVTCAFKESRTFPFKKTPAILEGASDYLPRQGLVLRYASPEQRVLGIKADTIVEIDSNGGKKCRELPRQYENMLSIYDLDLQKLAQDFTIYFDEEGDVWTIRLVEKPGLITAGRQREIKSAPFGITIRGEGESVRSLEMNKPGAIAIYIRMEAARKMTPAETAATSETLRP